MAAKRPVPRNLRKRNPSKWIEKLLISDIKVISPGNTERPCVHISMHTRYSTVVARRHLAAWQVENVTEIAVSMIAYTVYGCCASLWFRGPAVSLRQHAHRSGENQFVHNDAI
jgi:hypothetical protein